MVLSDCFGFWFLYVEVIRICITYKYYVYVYTYKFSFLYKCEFLLKVLTRFSCKPWKIFGICFTFVCATSIKDGDLPDKK